ncbi:MAG: CRTAC1 family protein, partial [Bacteroidota bacterium]
MNYHKSIGLLALVCLSISTFAQTFSNIADDQGMNVYTGGANFGAGASFFDFNQDGWDDVSFCSNNQTTKFFVNNGDNTFTEVTFDAVQDNTEAKQITWVDYDNDGDPDLFISYRFDRIRLYQNQGDLVFEEVATEVGLRDDQELAHWGCSWADYDKDGWLDLYVCKVTASGDLETEYELYNNLYHSNGDGTFTDVTLAAGVGDSLGISYQSSFLDYDGDGWLDIMVINDKWFLNSMYRNNGDGTFSDVGEETQMGYLMDAMCIAADDFDNDFDTDVYVSNTWLAGDGEGNLLFVNDNGVFDALPEETGINVLATCWGSQWVDYDNNGLQDLWNTANYGLNFNLNPFFINEGGNVFTQANDLVGLAGNQDVGYGVAMGDINNDGYPDIIQNNAHPHESDVYLNSGGDKNWFKVGLEGTMSNKDAIGSLIKVFAGGLKQQRQTHCGEGYLSQNSSREMFGLDNHQVVDSV